MRISENSQEKVHVEAIGQNIDQTEARIQEGGQESFKNHVRVKLFDQYLLEVHNFLTRRCNVHPRVRPQELQMHGYMMQDSDFSDEDENLHFGNQDRMSF